MEYNGTIRSTDIHSLTEFQRNAKRYIGQVKETRSPMVITVNGEAEVVVQDAASYQEMVDELEHVLFIAAIREGMEDAQAGRVTDFDQAMDEIRDELGLSD